MLKLAEIFQNGMVLQRNKPIRLWGKSDRDQQIEIYIDAEFVKREHISKGDFEVELPMREASTGITLSITYSDNASIILTNIDIGEVWIAGGQSNMEFQLRYDKDGDKMIAGAKDPHFRFYDVGKYAWKGEREMDLKDHRYWDRWLEFNSDNAPYFSAVGVYFALRLRRELDVPVAIIGCNWGGSPASAWLDEKIIRRNRKLRIYADEFDCSIAGIDMERYLERLKHPSGYDTNPKVAAQIEKRMCTEILKKPNLLTYIVGKIIVLSSKTGPYDYNRPGGLYENMIKKIAGYTCSGFLWYQGEADYLKADIYDELLSQLIICWRKTWGEELPFLITQLTSYLGWKECSGKNYHILREQQQRVADRMNKVYLASIMDVGSKYDIHPKKKEPVGTRLAGLALHYIYGRIIECEAPRMVTAKQVGNVIVIIFNHVPEKLQIVPARQEPDKDDQLSGLFEVRSNKQKVHIKAKLCGNKVKIVCREALGDDLTVAFAYRPYAPMTLFADNGLAARPCPPMKVCLK